MDWFARRFIRSSLVWLCVGVTLGVAMAVHPAFVVYRPAHLHATLLGFVAMMIFGVAYHVLPRFAGTPLRSRPAAGFHWWVANIGLAGMIIGFVLRVSPRAPAPIAIVALGAGGSLSALGAFCFAWNIWTTLGGTPLTVVNRAAPPQRQRASS